MCACSKDNLTTLIFPCTRSTANMTALVYHTPTNFIQAPNATCLNIDWTRPDSTIQKDSEVVKPILHKQNPTSQQFFNYLQQGRIV